MTSGRFVALAALALAAGVSLAFSNGQYAHPIASWIAPVLTLRLARMRKPRWALASTYAVFLAAWIVAWAGVFRLDPVALAPMALILSLLGFLPYLLDRLFVPRLPALAGSFVLPSANATIELALSAVSPFGAWGLIGYSQAEFLPLAQIASVTGTLGIGFLIFWFAAVANLLWEDRRGGRASAAAFAVPAALTLSIGGLRLSDPGAPPRLRTAIVIPPVEDNLNYDEALAPAIQAALFRRTELAARRGAQLVVWPEDSFFIRGTEEAALLQRAATMAARLRIHLGIAYGSRVDPAGLRYRNRFVLLRPNGGTAWRYDKSYPVPGYEAVHMLAGDRRIVRYRSPLGLVSGAICFDGDHDPMLRQLGSTSLLLLPSDDWPAIRTLHARMTRLRALEFGVPVVRPTLNGLSIIVDRHGRLLAARDSRTAGDVAAIAEVPVAGTPTPYARAGSSIGGLYPTALLLLAGAAALRRRRNRPPAAVSSVVQAG